MKCGYADNGTDKCARGRADAVKFYRITYFLRSPAECGQLQRIYSDKCPERTSGCYAERGGNRKPESRIRDEGTDRNSRPELSINENEGDQCNARRQPNDCHPLSRREQEQAEPTRDHQYHAKHTKLDDDRSNALHGDLVVSLSPRDQNPSRASESDGKIFKIVEKPEISNTSLTTSFRLQIRISPSSGASLLATLRSTRSPELLI